MPRRDLTEERTAQILDAFARCVVKYGLDGTSLEQVAEEAGVKRSILRHYVGNRDDLMNAMVERVVKKYSQQLRMMVAYLPKAGNERIETLLSLLFQPEPDENAQETFVFETLIAAAGRYPQLRSRLREPIEEFVDTVADQLELVFPHAQQQCWTVAYGIVSLYLTYASLAPLTLPQAHTEAALESARCLVASLGQE